MGGSLKISELMKLVVSERNDNFFVEAPDQLGLTALLPKYLEQIAAQVDIHVIDAGTLSKDKARALEKEARYAPHGSSEKTHFLIYGLQRLPPASVGPLLKVVEESKYARWIFQAQRSSRWLETLKSRSTVVRLAFLAKKTVMGNLRRMNLDAVAAEKANLYDGTLSGTAKALNMKDTLTSMRRAVLEGPRGLVSLYSVDSLNSLAFDTAISDRLSLKQKYFLMMDPTEERKRLVLWLMVHGAIKQVDIQVGEA